MAEGTDFGQDQIKGRANLWGMVLMILLMTAFGTEVIGVRRYARQHDLGAIILYATSQRTVYHKKTNAMRNAGPVTSVFYGMPKSGRDWFFNILQFLGIGMLLLPGTRKPSIALGSGIILLAAFWLALVFL